MEAQEEVVVDDRTVITLNPADSRPAGEQSDSLVGQLINDRYEVLGRLGAGGMSTVYKVRHIHLDKIYALKILHDQTDESLKRFQLEARASTLLEHANIINVCDFGIRDGHPYMVMDCLAGQPLSHLIKSNGSLEPKRAIRIFSQICSALAHAHEHGIIHRDIKPSNIVVDTSPEGVDHVVVLDFGIAKIMRNDNEAQELTRTGDIFGTPLYMSPEQCQGQKVDHRTDIYSLGCVLYEALTGKSPFHSENVYQTIHRQINEAPPPFPSQLRKHRALAQLEAVVIKAMAKSPANRHKFALEMASELMQVGIDDTGLFGNVVSNFRVLAGRLNAVERSRAVMRSAIQALSVVALILSILVFALPDELKTAQKEVRRNLRIVSIMTSLFSLQFDDQETLFNGGVAQVKPLFDELGRLTKGHREQFDLFKTLRKNTVLAQKQQIGFAKVVYETMSQDGIRMDSFDSLRSTLSGTVKLWVDGGRLSTQLHSMSWGLYVQAKDKVNALSLLLSLATVLGIIVEIALVCLSFQLIAKWRARKAEERQQSLPLPGSDSKN